MATVRVSFVWLNHDTPVGFSHGLAALSAELKDAGHRVGLVHVNERLGLPFDLGRIGRRLQRQQPDVVGISFGSNHAASAGALARQVRKVLPGVWIVAGGVHTTLYPEQVMSWPEVDIAALGEADDYRLAEVLDDLERGRAPRQRAGFWYRRRAVIRNPMAPPVDLSRSRAADWGLFDHRRILQLKRGWADVHGGRGCPGRCTYCFNQPMRRRYLDVLGGHAGRELPYVRKRPLDIVLEELRQCQIRYGEHIRVFSFTDDQFIVGRRWLFEFLEAYAGTFRIPLVFLSSPGSIDREVAERCAAAGVYMVRLGIESGSARVRERVLGRPIPSSAIRRAVSSLQSNGVNAFAFQMLGIPGETMTEVWQTFRSAARLHLDAVKFSLFWPYPGTQLYELCQRKHLIRSGFEFVGNNIQDTPLRWPAERQRFLRRVAGFTDLAMNRFLDLPRTDHYAALLGRLRSMSDVEWEQGGAWALRHEADQLNRTLLQAGQSLYTAPFDDRPDILLLQGRTRLRALFV
ncbi:B12-binding domain-containing radical SAM protein [Myxococcota bacterium]